MEANLIEGLTGSIRKQRDVVLATTLAIGYLLRRKIVNGSNTCIELDFAINRHGIRWS